MDIVLDSSYQHKHINYNIIYVKNEHSHQH